MFKFTEHFFFITELFDYNEAAVLVLNFNKKEGAASNEALPVHSIISRRSCVSCEKRPIPSLPLSNSLPINYAVSPSVCQRRTARISLEEFSQDFKLETLIKNFRHVPVLVEWVRTETSLMKNCVRLYDWPVLQRELSS